MSRKSPSAAGGVPAALTPLLNKNTVFVRQHVEMMELITNHEMPNEYTVMDRSGQPIYRVVEQSDYCSRQCNGTSRSFTGHLDDFHGNSVIINRPSTACCAQENATVSSEGQLLGRILQNRKFLTSTLVITDAQQKGILEIEIPIIKIGTVICVIKMAGGNGRPIGAITKQWAGYVQESATDADNFNITFPGDLDVKLKAVLVGACIIIDFMYFENTPQPRNQGLGNNNRFGNNRGVGNF